MKKKTSKIITPAELAVARRILTPNVMGEASNEYETSS